MYTLILLEPNGKYFNLTRYKKRFENIQSVYDEVNLNKDCILDKFRKKIVGTDNKPNMVLRTEFGAHIAVFEGYL